ncbi:MAG: hypothetical protein ACERKN_09370 [Velocimicrobium sp.]
MNSYIYCYNNPLIYRDPSGHIVIEATAVTFFVVATAGTVVYVSYRYITSSKDHKSIKEGIVSVKNDLKATYTYTKEVIKNKVFSIKGKSNNKTEYTSTSKKENTSNKDMKLSKSKGENKADPYARESQKKQGRERKNKAREKDNWKPKSNPKPPKKHTPGREHRKY